MMTHQTTQKYQTDTNGESSIHTTELTSKSTGAGGGGKVDLSTFRLVAFSLPVFVLAFFPMMINVQYHFHSLLI